MVVILGPQRRDGPAQANVQEALREVAANRAGPVVVLAAGWRADEMDEGAIRALAGPDAAVLPLYNWFEVVMRELPELRAAYRARQDALGDLRRLHRARLHPALQVVRDLTAEARRSSEASGPASASLVQRHLELAWEDVRRIDAQLVEAAAAIFAEHARASQPWTHHPAVERLRERATEALSRARAVVVTGGHVAILLNRMQFFGVDRALVELEGTPIVAWSAGAMVLTERIVLFYDDPPDGPAYPELLDRGLGLAPDLVALPHARMRLRLDDPARVGMVATRFGPSPCVGLEAGARLHRERGRWVSAGPPGSAVQLLPAGGLAELPRAGGLP